MTGTTRRSTRGKRSKPASPSGDNQSPPTTALTPRSTNIEVAPPSKKRKAEDDSEPTGKKLRSESAAQSAAPVTPLAKALGKATLATPPTKPRPTRKATPAPIHLGAAPSSSETLPAIRKRRCESPETGQTEALLERLHLDSPSASKRKKTTTHRRDPPHEFDLPQELNDLLNLHVAFLRTIDMHCAHHGTNTPVDLEDFLTSVTRVWHKRVVGLPDVQRCIGVLEWSPVKSEASKAPYFLCDYGREKICLEFHPDAEPGPLRQHQLNMEFEANLRTLWRDRTNRKPADLFIRTLPTAPIQLSASVVAAQSLQRNQTTLNSFKKSITQKKQQSQEQAGPYASPPQSPSKEQPGPYNTPPQTPNAPKAARKTTLLNRIRAKEQQAVSQGGSTPSRAELERRAGLQRVCDVAAVIGMLCKATERSPNAQRVSFPLDLLRSKLKDSSRTPISHEDATVTVQLIASEVAPEWLAIVRVNCQTKVLCMLAMQPSKAALEERVAALLA
jgi:hypothetical protein